MMAAPDCITFFDAAGRVLTFNAAEPPSGVVTPGNVIRREPAGSGHIFVLSSESCVGLGATDAQLLSPAARAAALVFEEVAAPAGTEVLLRTVPGSRCIRVGADGSATLADVGSPLAVARNPVIGTLHPAWALSSGARRKIALWGGTQRGWLTAHPVKLLGGGHVTSRTERLVVWEQWTLEVVRGGGEPLVALCSTHGRWLSSAPNGTLTADKKTRDGWELFELVTVPGAIGYIGLRSVAHTPRRFVSARNARVDATAEMRGEEETFLLLDAEEAARHYWDRNPVYQPPPAADNDGGVRIGSILAVTGAVLAGAAVVGAGIATAVLAGQARDYAANANAVATQAARSADAAAVSAADAAADAAAAAASAAQAMSAAADAATAAEAIAAAADEATAAAAERARATSADDPAAAVQRMVRDAASAEAAVAGCSELWSIATRLPFARDSIVAAGGLKAIVAAITTHLSDPDVARQGCRALRATVDGSRDRVTAAIDANSVAIAIDAMRVHAGDASVAGVGCHLLSALLTGNWAAVDACSAVVLREGGPAAIVAAMTTHVDDATVASCGSLAFGKFLWGSPGVTRDTRVNAAVNAGAPAAVVRAMRAHPNSVRVQSNGLYALAMLCVGGTHHVAAVTTAGGPDAAVAVLRAHVGSEYIAATGSHALGNMAWVSGPSRETVVAAGACAAIVAALRTHVGTARVLEAGSMALRRIAATHRGSVAAAGGMEYLA